MSNLMSQVPPDWDNSPISLALEIKDFLERICDERKSVDAGTMDGQADLWVTIGGVEFYIGVKKSNTQFLKEGKTREELGLPNFDGDGNKDDEQPKK